MDFTMPVSDANSLASVVLQPGNRVLFSVLLMNGTAFLLYTNVCVLLPMYILEEHPVFNGLAVGILFASYQITFILFAPIIGRYLASFGRRRALVMCVATVSMASTVFALAGKIENDYVFYAVSLMARMI